MSNKEWPCIKTEKKTKNYHKALKEFEDKKGNLLVMIWKRRRNK